MNRKIGIKLIFVVGLTAIIIIGVYAYINIHSQRDVLIAEVERHSSQLSEAVKKSIHNEMLTYHPERIQETLTSVSEDPCLHKIRIMNDVGNIIYSSSAEEIGKMVNKDTESCYACHAADKPIEHLSIRQRTRIFHPHPDSARVIGIINPIYNEPSCWQADCHVHSADKKVLGVLDITMCLKEVDRAIEHSTVRAVLFAIIAILAISVLIGTFVQRWVARPVNYLLEATKQVAAGNLNYTIKNLGDDELALLAKSFNHMTKKMAEARQQLFQSDKMASLGRLAAGVAHEINNPLTGVLTYSSFLLKRTKNQPEIQEDLKVIVRETLRSREIVKGLLDFARQSIPKKRKSDISEIIERAIRVVENQLSLKHIKVKTQLEKDAPQVTVDANQIQQVFINLLVNAGDAISGAGGEITVTTQVLGLLLFGNEQVKQATCPKNHSLIDSESKIEGLPSIKVNARVDGYLGTIHIDPIYGRQRHQYSKSVLREKIVQLFCPECDTSLIDETKKCPSCKSTVYSIVIPSQGILEGCTKYGCGWQRWDVIDAIGKTEYLECTIEDTGSGIAKEDLDKIFEPFYTTKGQSGTGLGLSVIWGIIDNHGGRVNVSSEQGRGTIFTLRIPVEQYI